ncbi:RNA polymerase sigma factor [Nitrospira sp. M1]
MNRFEHIDDHGLIDLIAQGDLDAFEGLYDRYASKVLKRCYFICLNATDARDLMQEVWMRVFLRLHQFKKQAAFSTWLYRLTTNHCLNFIKAKAQTANVETNMETTSPPVQDPTQTAEAHHLLARLSIEDRSILALKFMGEYTYEEIATSYGIGVSAAKMRVSRLIDKLREEVRT